VYPGIERQDRGAKSLARDGQPLHVGACLAEPETMIAGRQSGGDGRHERGRTRGLVNEAILESHERVADSGARAFVVGLQQDEPRGNCSFQPRQKADVEDRAAREQEDVGVRLADVVETQLDFDRSGIERARILRRQRAPGSRR
jgi:hypothetical protein